MKTENCDVLRVRTRWVALTVLLVANFLAVLASTIVTVAIPSIRAGLELSDTATVWVLGAYALCYGVVLIPGGRWGDLAGRKRVFLVGLAGFCLGGLIAATAPQGWVMIAGAAIQGCAAGLTVPQVLGSIPALFAPEERGRAFGLYGVATGLGAAVGPLAGGLLLAWDPAGLAWRSVFGVLVVLGLAALVIGWRVLPASPKRPGTIDALGTALLALALVLLLVPLTLSQHDGWSAASITAAIASGPALALFAWRQHTRQVHRQEPLLRLTLLRHRGFTAALLVGLCYFAAFQGMLFVAATSLQAGSHLTPLAAGLCLTPFAIASMVVSLQSDRITRRLGTRTIAVGAILVIVGLGTAIAVTSTNTGPVALAAALVIVGLGHGLIVPPNVAFGLRDIPPALAGGAGGAINTVQRIGQSLGVAAIGGTFLASATTNGYDRALPVALATGALAAVATLIAALVLPRSPRRP
ncbi:MFS transporter [Pseudonocardia phyllosphaerae]|uniref:MFS transporter n=1 Tax=Pseudonocardia phyllosphaerae TaxID=3390502 RepID=UPI0039796AA2